MTGDSNSIPPGNYNFIPRPYHPDRPYGRTTPGLIEKVNSLYGQGRSRSALDEVFKVLDEDPENQQALELASIVVGGLRTAQEQALEPLTDAYLLDRRLDPLATVCIRCKKSWMGGDPLLIPFLRTAPGFISFNSGAPRPMQCTNCGYVLCSECITEIMANDPLEPGTHLPTKCPACGAEKFKRPAFPTGRPPQQMNRHAEPVVDVMVFREGPVPPDEPYLREFLERFSPDAIKDHAKLVGIPLFPWPGNVEAIAQEALAEKEASGGLPTGFLVEFARSMDDQENRLYIAKVMRPMHKGGRADPNSRGGSVLGRWKEALGEWLSSLLPSELNRTVEGLMRNHIIRITEHPNFRSNAAVVAFYRSLLKPALLSFVLKTVASLLAAAQQADQQQTTGKVVDDTFVLVSVVPQLAPDYARSYFGNGYLKFLDAQIQQAGVRIGTKSIVHWIYCTDGKNGAVHLTTFPKAGQHVVALDMLTATERSQIGY